MAEVSPAGSTWETFIQSFMASPKNRANALRVGEYENSPVYDMLASSSGLDYLRQRLPQWSGGYSPQEKQKISQMRAADPELRRYTVEVGKVPGPSFAGEVPTPGRRHAAAQAAGALGADVATDGARNIWWFLNAPQAISMLATQQAIKKGGESFLEGAPIIRNRNLRMAASVPAWLGMSLGVGNFMRAPGYKAVVPGEGDPREAANPAVEAASRYFLGRSGRLLPYDEFVKERPDVSRAEYNAYKRYLFSSPSPIKATLDGIHGPEVTFMGKSMPVATAVLPAVASTAGAWLGARKAGTRLASQGKLQTLGRLKQDHANVRARKMREGVSREELKNNPEVQAAFNKVADQEMRNEIETLKEILKYSGGALGGTALIGQGVESIRRANNQARED